MKIKILKENYLDIPIGAVVECTDCPDYAGVEIDASVCHQYNLDILDDGFQYFLSYEEVEVVDDN